MPATLTDYIADDLRARLIAGELELPTTLEALAEHYAVSLTPVRAAVALLLDEGTLRRREGKLVAGRKPRRVRPVAAPDAWEAALEEDILRRGLLGPAEYLREEATAATYGVGRTVLRAAFGRLAARGLLVQVPRCGWRVRTFDLADMEAYLEVREVLEVKALDLAFPHLERADLERLWAGNPATGARLDNALHGYLIEKSGNAYLRDFFDRHGGYHTALFEFAAPEAHVRRAMAGQHRAILSALLAGERDVARAALAAHIRAQRPIVGAILTRLASATLSPSLPR